MVVDERELDLIRRDGDACINGLLHFGGVEIYGAERRDTSVLVETLERFEVLPVRVLVHVVNCARE